jgi:DNA-binding MarR family transcriptional regulator
VSSGTEVSEQPTGGLPAELTYRLGYLLKHAQHLVSESTALALEPVGISGRELAVLTLLAAGAPLSQQEAARRLSIDRTTMVAMVDALEGKALVVRHADPIDRRRNIVEVTGSGQAALRDATERLDEVERGFLARLDERDGQRLREMLNLLVFGDVTTG